MLISDYIDSVIPKPSALLNSYLQSILELLSFMQLLLHYCDQNYLYHQPFVFIYRNPPRTLRIT